MRKLFLIIVFFLSTALSAAWDNELKLTAFDGAADDRFGTSVSISGDYAVIGANFDDDNGSNSGSAYIFIRSGAAWSEQAKLTASDGAANDHFGNEVSISGDYALIGAYYDDEMSGSAYIFHRSGTTWSEQAKLTASDAAADDRFGVSVSISGDYAVIGAYYDDDNGFNSGSAYIFLRSGTAWSEQTKITVSDGAPGDHFGWPVSISGDYAVIGASFDDDYGAQSGSAYIFHRSGTVWSEQAKITASDGAAVDIFGHSVCIDGDYAVIGAYGDDSCTGSAYIFHRSGITWAEQVKLTASDGASDDHFGVRVSISGDYALIAARYDDNENGIDSGSAYVYFNDDVSIEDVFMNIPNNRILLENYPNPFNPGTTIIYQLLADSKVELTVCNLKGQKVKQLVSNSAGQLSAGQHSVVWNGKDDNGKSVSSGIYFYKLKTGNYEKTKRIILLK